MSYSEDLIDRIDVVFNHLKKGVDQSKAISKFLKFYVKSLDQFQQQVSQNYKALESQFPREGSLDTLNACIDTLLNNIYLSNKKIDQIQNLMLNEVIDPLDVFIEHFQETNEYFFIQMKAANQQYQQAKIKVTETKNKYYNIGLEAQRLESILQSQQSNEKLTNSYLDHKNLLATAQSNYRRSIQEYNKYYQIFNEIAKPSLEGLQQNEQSRIQFLKQTIEKFSKVFENLSLTFMTGFQEIKGILVNVSSEVDIKVFIDLNKSGNTNLKEEFVTFAS